LEFINISAYLLLGLTGYYIFYVFKLPVPALLGAFAVVAINQAGEFVPMADPHHYFNIVLQVILGLNVAVKITPSVFRQLLSLILPASLMSIWALLVTFGGGYLLYIFTDLDSITALLGASPGGIGEIGIIAVSVGADVPNVSLLQVFRLMLTFFLFPVIAVRNSTFEIDRERESFVDRLKDPLYTLMKSSGKIELSTLNHICKILVTFLVAFTGGIIGAFLAVPAGPMLGSLILTAALVVKGVKLQPLPLALVRLMQTGIGVMIGLYFSREILKEISSPDMLLVLLLFSVIILTASFIMASIMRGITGWDKTTCLIATAPAGFSTMTALAQELNSNPLEVSILHLARMLTLKITIPLVLLFF